MSEQKSPRNRNGCLLAIFGTILLVGALVVGAAAATFFNTTRAVTAPIRELTRNIGIGATPVVRPDPVTVIKSINDLAQLQTASYQMEKIVTAEKNTDSLLGLFEDTLIFVAVGEVTAGIDLAKLTENDIRATSFQTVTIRLPDPEIFIATLDNENSYVADRDTGLLANADPEMETLVRQEAQRQIEAAALEQGILDIADENAQSVLAGLLESLGFETIIFVDGDLPPPVPIIDPEIPKGFIVTPAP